MCKKLDLYKNIRKMKPISFGVNPINIESLLCFSIYKVQISEL